MFEEEISSSQAIDDVHCPPILKIKGRPTTKRLKDGKEARNLSKTCGLRKKVGHNITTCPDKEKIGLAYDSQNKKKKI